jgi:hypothetical protein
MRCTGIDSFVMAHPDFFSLGGTRAVFHQMIHWFGRNASEMVFTTDLKR